MLEEEQQKEAQNNQQQQQIHSQVILPSTITATYQNQVPNISHRNNLFGQKMTPWKLLSSLLSIE